MKFYLEFYDGHPTLYPFENSYLEIIRRDL